MPRIHIAAHSEVEIPNLQQFPIPENLHESPEIQVSHYEGEWPFTVVKCKGKYLPDEDRRVQIRITKQALKR
jgi:cytochrome oxidase assembly protein ShyY1